MTVPGNITARAATPPTNLPDDFESAAEALRREVSPRHPKLRAAAELIEARRFGDAMKLLREFVRDHPRDTTGLYLAAEAAAGLGHHGQAEALLAACIEIDRNFTAARYTWVAELIKLNRAAAALAESEVLLRQAPANPLFRTINGIALESVGNHPAAAEVWRQMTQQYPSWPECWERLGKAMWMMGNLEECIAAFRQQIALDPFSAGGWRNLSDLKTFRFEDSDIEQMEALLARPDVSSSDRTCLHFALGNAYLGQERFDKSFENYAKGNALNRIAIKHDPDILTNYVQRCRQVFTPEFFCRHANSGCPAPDPIFIVGMPRSGSTLVEQILASHPMIEGTRELADLNAIAMNLTRTAPRAQYPHLARLDDLDVTQLKASGEAYLEAASAYRKLGRPFFTDKMGANFVHVGLIQLILPNARIVDVRRHPMACCFSNFAQLFRKGQDNAYRLTDLGRLYRDYVELMAHFDSVLPGKVHRIVYEDLVERPESEVRRVLDYLGLPFEESCLHFHKTERAVLTVSAEQVRRPINRDGLDRWRNYEPWLEPLKSVLGPILETYPDVPPFA